MTIRKGTASVKKVLDSINENEDNSNVLTLLSNALARYSDSIRFIEIQKKLEKGKLLELDTFVQNLESKEEINKDDLIKIFTWKITRGKFRPLINQINKNNDNDIKRISRSAFTMIREKKWENGIKILSELKGVGVATSTAFFAIDKNNIPFMCDEVLEAITGSRDYKLSSYSLLRKELISKGSLIGLTASDLCQALWSHSVLTEYDQNYNKIIEGNKRSNNHDNLNDEEKPSKRHKGMKK
jgi:hypothetical protein